MIVDRGDSLAKVEFSELSNQLEDKKLYIGMMTRSKLKKFLDEGDISQYAVTKFMKGSKRFF